MRVKLGKVNYRLALAAMKLSSPKETNGEGFRNGADVHTEEGYVTNHVTN